MEGSGGRLHRHHHRPPSVGNGADGGEVDEDEAARPRVSETEPMEAKSTKAKPPAPECRRRSRRRRGRQPAERRVPAIPLGRVAVGLVDAGVLRRAVVVEPWSSVSVARQPSMQVPAGRPLGRVVDS